MTKGKVLQHLNWRQLTFQKSLGGGSSSENRQGQLLDSLGGMTVEEDPSPFSGYLRSDWESRC